MACVNKVDGILEGPKYVKVQPVAAGEGEFLSDICDGACLACPAFVGHVGNCKGEQWMENYDQAVDAMKNIALYFEQYVDGSRLNGALELATEAVRALNPTLKNLSFERLSEARTAIGLLRTQVEDDNSSARAVGELKVIIKERLKDLTRVERWFEKCLA